jgi:hypothetical protein
VTAQPYPRVYLRADTTPPLRVLMYASLQPPSSTLTHQPLPAAPAVPAAAAAADANDAAAADAVVEAIGAAKLVDACGASPELIAAVLEALAADPPPPPPSATPSKDESSNSNKISAAADSTPSTPTKAAAEKAAAERAAAWRGTLVRDTLTQTYGPFWHVVHDSHAFGAAVHESTPGLRWGCTS